MSHEDEDIESIPTFPKTWLDESSERRGVWGRRVVLGLLSLFIVSAVAGFFGTKTATVEKSSGRLRAELEHASIARPGLEAPYRLTIKSRGGFSGPVEVRISTPYLEILDYNQVHPEPASATATDAFNVWTFEPPAGEVLVVWMDSRVDSGSIWNHDGRTIVVVGKDRVDLRHSVWLFP